MGGVSEYWGANQVCDIPSGVSAEESLRALQTRNDAYPGLLDLMPCSKTGLDVLDFGCGPGHDTLMFLLNGARHVYAADVSWYGLSMLRDRLVAHGLLDRCTLMLVPEDGEWCPPPVDHIFAAGVLHHCSDPVSTLRRLSSGLRAENDEIRIMVYSSESWWYNVRNDGDPETFRARSESADGCPIVRAWTKSEVFDIARAAGLRAEYLGSYRVISEPEGPGLSSCYSVKR